LSPSNGNTSLSSIVKQQRINDYWKPRRMVIAFCAALGVPTRSSYSYIAIITEADLKLEALRVTAISIRDKIRKRLVIY